MSGVQEKHNGQRGDAIKAMLRRNPALRSAGIAIAGPSAIRVSAGRQGLRTRVGDDRIDIMRGNDVVRLSRQHLLYAFDVIAEFDYYFNAVQPLACWGQNVVDYSRPSWHDVREYDLHPIFFPSFSEPLITTRQYLDFAQLQPGQNAIDLGAYSGLSALLFKDEVGKTGKVVAVDADKFNLAAVERNVKLHAEVTGLDVEVMFGAVWRENGEISFSAEGNMGSSASAIVGAGRGETVTVPCATLSAIADRYGLATVDFIKADIEGGEAFIFEDAEFFRRFRPRIIVEPHMVDGQMTTAKVTRDLGAFGYSCRPVPQLGSSTPLLECTPPA